MDTAPSLSSTQVPILSRAQSSPTRNTPAVELVTDKANPTASATAPEQPATAISSAAPAELVWPTSIISTTANRQEVDPVIYSQDVSLSPAKSPASQQTVRSRANVKRVRFPASPELVTHTHVYDAIPKRLHGSLKQVAEWGAEVEEDEEVRGQSTIIGGRTLSKRK